MRAIGLCITTGRYSGCNTWWDPHIVAGILLETFPSLKCIGLHLEVSCECRAQHKEGIMELLRVFREKQILVRSYDVFLIQLSSSVRQTEAKLQWLGDGLRSSGVQVNWRPRARSCKEAPCDGFAVPASLCLSAPHAVCYATCAAVWDTVWW